MTVTSEGLGLGGKFVFAARHRSDPRSCSLTRVTRDVSVNRGFRRRRPPRQVLTTASVTSSPHIQRQADRVGASDSKFLVLREVRDVTAIDAFVADQVDRNGMCCVDDAASRPKSDEGRHDVLLPAAKGFAGRAVG